MKDLQLILECDGNYHRLLSGNSFSVLLDLYHGEHVQDYSDCDANSFIRTFPDSESFQHDAFYVEVDQKNHNCLKLHLVAQGDGMTEAITATEDYAIIATSASSLDDVCKNNG